MKLEKLYPAGTLLFSNTIDSKCTFKCVIVLYHEITTWKEERAMVLFANGRIYSYSKEFLDLYTSKITINMKRK